MGSSSVMDLIEHEFEIYILYLTFTLNMVYNIIYIIHMVLVNIYITKYMPSYWPLKVVVCFDAIRPIYPSAK